MSRPLSRLRLVVGTCIHSKLELLPLGYRLLRNRHEVWKNRCRQREQQLRLAIPVSSCPQIVGLDTVFSPPPYWTMMIVRGFTRQAIGQSLWTTNPNNFIPPIAHKLFLASEWLRSQPRGNGKPLLLNLR